jgi:hypothetical protein
MGTYILTRLSFAADEGQGKAASKGGSTEVVLGDPPCTILTLLQAEHGAYHNITKFGLLNDWGMKLRCVIHVASIMDV